MTKFPFIDNAVDLREQCSVDLLGDYGGNRRPDLAAVGAVGILLDLVRRVHVAGPGQCLADQRVCDPVNGQIERQFTSVVESGVRAEEK